MANVNNPHGLRPLGISLTGGCPVFDELSKAVGYGTAIFVYDAINRVADGSIEASATPGTTFYSGVSMNYGAASTATTHTICISPDAIYEAQVDDATGLAATDMGLNANLLLTAGNATTKVSKHTINHTGIDVTNTLDVHLLGLLNVADNVFGGYARIEIVFNKHRMAPATVGV